MASGLVSFISDGKFSETEREFRWVATDTKVDRFRQTHMEIEGGI